MLTKRFVRQQQRREIMQCFVYLVNSSFSAVCTRLIKLFGALQKQDANYSKTGREHTSPVASTMHCRHKRDRSACLRFPSIQLFVIPVVVSRSQACSAGQVPENTANILNYLPPRVVSVVAS
jgi:hypothetical protein